MSYCINPKCFGRENFDSADKCQTCGTPLLINNRYRIVCPLREPDPAHPTDLFEVRDWGLEAEDWGAVKVMKVLKYTNNPDLVRLFKREARTLMWLRDPGIPMVEPDGYFTVAIDRGSKLLHCLVMEKIEGQDLDDWIELNGPISPDEAIAWLKQLVQILDRLHERSLFHRDIKPSNLIVRPNGQLGLVDFGTVGIEESHKTKVGTAGYAAPEQLLGNGEARSDFFALGRTFVYLLSGVPPMNFPERKNGKLLWKTSVPHLPKVLVDFVDRLMEPMLERRPKNTQLLLKQVYRLEQDIDLFGFTSWSQEQWKLIQSSLKFLAILGVSLTGLRFTSPAVFASFSCVYEAKGLSGCFEKVGYSRMVQKKIHEANFFFRSQLLISPGSGKAHYNLGWICEEEKHFACAVKNYNQVLEKEENGKNEDDTAVPYATSSLARLEIWIYKDFDRAISLLESEISRTERLRDRGELRIKASAISAMYKNLAWAYLEKGDYTTSQIQLEKAIELNPENVAAHCLLAQAEEATGNNMAALQSWVNCLSYPSPNNPEVGAWQRRAKERIDNSNNSTGG